jgi:hypothetical protein
MIAEKQQTGFMARPMQLNTLRKIWPELYLQLINSFALKSKEIRRLIDVDKLIANVDSLAEKHLLVEW